MTTITINRGEATTIGFSINDTNNSLAGKRVTVSFSTATSSPRKLRKVGGLPGSTADITITSQTAGNIAGFINITVADFAILTLAQYVMTTWVDDNAGLDRCGTVGGVDTLAITDNVPRAA